MRGMKTRVFGMCLLSFLCVCDVKISKEESCSKSPDLWLKWHGPKLDTSIACATKVALKTRKLKEQF